MAEKKLTGKQKKWLEAYFICGFNATEAARRAEYAEPNKSGPENLQNPVIKALIDERMKEHTMQANEVLFRLATHAQSDISLFMDESGTITRHSIKEAVNSGYGFLIKKITAKDTKYGEEISLELYDAQSALALIGRHHKLFIDKHEHGLDAETRKLLTREDLQELTDEQLAAIATGATTDSSRRASSKARSTPKSD
jgi:hypothetical protein